MDTLKTGQQLIDFITLCYKANRSPLLIGSHGIGKSEQAAQAAKALKIGFKSSDLSLMEPPDLIGLPKFKDNKTVYAPPSFLPTSGKGIWILEELNRSEKQMLAPCLQLLTARELNDYKLPTGWLPMAAVNPSDEGDYDVNELDSALMSRFTAVRVEPDHAGWLDWARSNDVHPSVVGYVASDATVFDQADSNPRAWKYVSDLLKASAKMSKSEVALRAGVMGQVGDIRGTSFLAWLNTAEHPLKAQDIFKSYPAHRQKLLGWLMQDHVDTAHSSLLSVLMHLQPHENYEEVRNDPASWQNLRDFFYDLPGDPLEKARSDFKERGYEFPKKPNARTRKGGKAA